MKLDELASKIDATVVGDGSVDVSSVASLDQAQLGQLAFVTNTRYLKQLETTNASAVIASVGVRCERVALLHTRNVYYAFAQAAVILQGHRKHPHRGVHTKAHVEPTAKIGEGTVVYPGAYIGARTTVGRDCIIYPNVVIYEDCKIGDRVIIHAGTVIGQDGFGFAQVKGTHFKIPQLGSVSVEDDVEIGANCCIARGGLETTTIGKGTKLDGAVVFGHGSKIGEHSILVAQVGIAGSVKIGHHVTMAGQVGVIGHITIGNLVTIAGQSGVIGDIEDNDTVIGSPALSVAQGRRVMLLTARLPELADRIKDLEQRVDELTESGDTPIA